MRALAVALLAAGILTSSARASSPRPFALVLHQIDVPLRYVYDKDNSVGPFRGPLRPATDPSSRVLLRAGFESGYIARYQA